MNIIVDIDNKNFSLNGIKYFKNYISNVAGNNLKIINAYDSNNVLLDWINFNQISVNGVIYGSVALLQHNLIDVCFNRSISIDPSVFLPSDLTDYPDATLPISDTTPLLVNQGGFWKKVNKSNIVTAGNSGGGWKQIIGFPFFTFITLNPSSYIVTDHGSATLSYYVSLGTNNANAIIPDVKTVVGVVNDNSILDKISFLTVLGGGNDNNVDIAVFMADTASGTNAQLIYNGVNLTGKVILENLNINIPKNKVLHFSLKCNTFITYYNWMYNLQFFLK